MSKLNEVKNPAGEDLPLNNTLTSQYVLLRTVCALQSRFYYSRPHQRINFNALPHSLASSIRQTSRLIRLTPNKSLAGHAKEYSSQEIRLRDARVASLADCRRTRLDVWHRRESSDGYVPVRVRLLPRMETASAAPLTLEFFARKPSLLPVHHVQYVRESPLSLLEPAESSINYWASSASSSLINTSCSNTSPASA